MKKKTAVILAAVVAALLVGLLIGRSGKPQSPDVSADASGSAPAQSADVSGSADASAPAQSADVSSAPDVSAPDQSAEPVVDEPAAQTDPVGRLWTEVLIYTMRELGMETSVLPADAPEQGEDTEVGKHTHRQYNIAPHIGLSVDTDPADAKLLRVGVFLSDGGDTDTLTAASYVMSYITGYFSGDQATQVQIDLGMLTAPEGDIRTVPTPVGTYTYMDLDGGIFMDFVAA